ncbi:MAG: AbrB/MazE/SpoVT family DNA-binding domain-containing protein [Candidatus Rokuibacteriota bacterium]|jgi:AbrB family looped-hinge helix DNA binding protein|nr:MAG: AbrB/MazE/SpoVT family DNA-binding domain-containing protein [Candidatus Rokubacteria bacterium]
MTLSRSVRVSRKGQLVIPKEMRDALGVKEGDDLLARLEDGRVILTRPRVYARITRGSLKGTWGKTRRAVERYVERQRRSWP